MYGVSWNVTYEKRAWFSPRIICLVFAVVLLWLIFQVKIDRKDVFYTRNLVVHTVEGEALVKGSSGDWRDLRKGDVIRQGDIVRTTEGSLTLQSWLNTRFILGSTTWIEVAEFSSDPWVTKAIKLDMELGELFVVAENVISRNPNVTVRYGDYVLQSHGGAFAVYFNSAGHSMVSAYENALSLNGETIWPSQSKGDGVLFAQFLTKASALIPDVREAILKALYERSSRVVRILPGDTLYPFKNLWSSFFKSLLVGDSVLRYEVALMEEYFMESVLASVPGDSSVDLSRALDQILAIKKMVSEYPDSYSYYFDLADRLQKLYEYSLVYPEALEVSHVLLQQIYMIRINDTSEYSKALFDHILFSLSIEDPSVYFEYLIPLSYMLQSISSEHTFDVYLDLRDRFAEMLEVYPDTYPELHRLYQQYML